MPSDEAGRLARVLKGKPCVPVLDLLGQVATAGNFEVIGAEIDGDERGVPATLVLSRGERVFKFGCHPADALVRRWLDRLSLTD